MSLNHSPSIVTNGLVFAYDMANTQKSWKGAPSTNYISTSPTWAGDGTDQSAFTKGYTEITNPDLMYYGLKTFLWRPGSSLNCYLQSDDIVGGTSTTSATWTFSCYVKAENNQAITSMGVYMYFPSSDGNVAGTITDVGRGWYRITRTRTGTANYISLIGFTGFTANVKYYLSGAMLTMDSIPVGPLNGNQTRTTTQALLDLTGNNTWTVNNLTYASDGTFSFNGSNSWIESATSSVFDSQTITMESWNKPTTTSQYGFLFEKGQVNTQYSNFYNADGTFYFRTMGLSQQDLAFTASTYITSGQWNHVVCVVGGGTKTVYINGIQRYQTTGITGTMPTGQINQYVGKYGNAGNNYPFNGSIAVSRVYNRALSAAEVKQNFSAHRGRFGI